MSAALALSVGVLAVCLGTDDDLVEAARAVLIVGGAVWLVYGFARLVGIA